MTDANPQTTQSQHWTEGFPHLVERAATLLGTDVATATRHSKVVPGGFHVWTPGRGGAQAVVGFDGAAYVRESCFSQSQMVQAFAAGHRNDATLAERPINHAASAVASMVGFLNGGETRTATPTGPSEAELADLMGGAFEQTTPDEIAERLRGRGKGAFAVVGVDRAHGPGHWYVAMFDGEHVHAFDSIANARTEWPPPAADAVRWWADGAPTRVPETVTADTRSRQGRRVWIRTTPALLPWAKGLLDWYASTDPVNVAAGRGTWYGLWWAALSPDGDDLRVAATDLTKDGITTLTWDVDPMLDVHRQQRELESFCRTGWQPTRFTETVLVYDGVYDAPEMYVERTSPRGDGASGWVVKPIAEQPRGGLLPVPAHELYRRAPHLVRYLSLPEGFRAVWSNGRTSTLRNPAGELVWEAAARDRDQGATPGHPAAPVQQAAPVQPAQPAAPVQPAQPAQPAAPAQPAPAGRGSDAASSQGAQRPSGGTAFEVAAAAVRDPAPDAARLLAAAQGLRDAFVRNEHLIGLLPPQAAQLMLLAYQRADEVGSSTGRPDVAREAALAWARERYFRELYPADDVAARVDRLVADDPDGAAHVLRGWMRYNGYGYAKDAAASVRDHEVAAERGNPDALFELSVLTATGQGVAADPARSRDLLERAAAAGHPRALYNVAAQHATGDGRPRDPERALALYVQAGERGNGRALFTAGIMTLTGDGTLPDPGRAAALLQQAQDLGFDVPGAAAQLPEVLERQVVTALGDV
ncbi:tetratricopeptide repeat protein [Cellulosimicrobium sp. Marseille-Q4280]|uniref:tetratricopeptide repeat protein n=1 Tax=Cellulosimicrobium sp. Marseille-Q4280 TaxID=2937992 RepID=UPI002041D51D|nr:tetratricopeptide repeat protein [Cellulosimicrobium sp. Marseille-Q4280]